MTGKQPIQGLVSASWAVLGQFPSSLLSELSNELLATMVMPEPLLPGKATHKWLKKNPSHPVLIAFITEANKAEVVEQIKYLRERLQNHVMRLVCFVDDMSIGGLSTQMSQLSIHRLQSQHDFSEAFLIELIQAEMQQHRLGDKSKKRREAELALLTWLARSGRDEAIQQRHLREVSALLNDLIGAHSLYLDAEAQLLQTFPEVNQGLDWSIVISQQFETLNLVDKPILVQLNAELALHQSATQCLGTKITGSILIPYRCYADINGYLLMLLTPDMLQQLDVSTVNLLEKTADQLRAHAERRQSEQRLQVQYERLQETLNQLYSTQEQLFHAEKLSSLGQLAAGIAHEINNPVSYVLSNFEPLDEYIGGMTELIKLHDRFAKALEVGDEQLRSQLLSTIHDREQSIDLEFVLEDVFSLVSDSRSGLTRVCDIVQNLKNFAHKDQVESDDFDLVACYRDSIGILKHQIADKIGIVEELPEKAIVKGNSGMMAQVIMNLIQNAVHAMPGGGKLYASISESDEYWWVRIQDTGAGIPAEIRSKVFDPFFTTKPIGTGTGLGLSTVYSIVERHKGKIALEDIPERGACFVVSLPK
jgi:two-component system NtrC family sensor kinase